MSDYTSPEGELNAVTRPSDKPPRETHDPRQGGSNAAGDDESMREGDRLGARGSPTKRQGSASGHQSAPTGGAHPCGG